MARLSKFAILPLISVMINWAIPTLLTLLDNFDQDIFLDNFDQGHCCRKLSPSASSRATLLSATSQTPLPLLLVPLQRSRPTSACNPLNKLGFPTNFWPDLSQTIGWDLFPPPPVSVLCALQYLSPGFLRLAGAILVPGARNVANKSHGWSWSCSDGAPFLLCLRSPPIEPGNWDPSFNPWIWFLFPIAQPLSLYLVSFFGFNHLVAIILQQIIGCLALSLKFYPPRIRKHWLKLLSTCFLCVEIIIVRQLPYSTLF